MQRDKKEAKRLYDIEYRRKNKELLKIKKAAHYREKVEYYRKKEKERRSKPENIKAHNEYCRMPEYVKSKRLYDVVYRSMKEYGEFWESAVLVNQIEKEVRNMVPKNERLYYTRNVNIATQRNNRRRLEKAIARIRSGESVDNILGYQWVEESRQILEMELYRNGKNN